MRRLAFALPVALAASLWGASASAHGGGGEVVPVPLPAFPPGDGLKAQQQIAALEVVVAKDAGLAKVAQTSLASAKGALQRAWGARAAGDVIHGRQLESLALEWAVATDAALRAATAERAAQAIVKAADDAARKVERVRALLAEAQARRERALAEIERLKVAEGDGKKGAAAAESARLKRPLAPAKKGKP